MKVPYVNLNGGLSYALPAIYFIIVALIILITGAGRYSLIKYSLAESKNIQEQKRNL